MKWRHPVKKKTRRGKATNTQEKSMDSVSNYTLRA